MLISAMQFYCFLFVVSVSVTVCSSQDTYQCFACTSRVPSCTQSNFLPTGTPTEYGCVCCLKLVNADNSFVNRTCSRSETLCSDNVNRFTCKQTLCNSATLARWQHTTQLWLFGELLLLLVLTLFTF